MPSKPGSKQTNEEDLFYLEYRGVLHISRVVLPNKAKTGTLCQPFNHYAIRPTDQNLVNFPICERCQGRFDGLLT